MLLFVYHNMVYRRQGMAKKENSISTETATSAMGKRKMKRTQCCGGVHVSSKLSLYRNLSFIKMYEKIEKVPHTLYSLGMTLYSLV